MKYSKLIKNLKKELSSKVAPGEVFNNIMEDKLQKIARKYKHNHELLLIGSYLSDIKLDEAIILKDLSKHVDLALKYSNDIFKKYNFSVEEIEIVKEIIQTHHGGEQTHIESKIFKNADNFKFLEPKGWMHLFGRYYEDGEISFKLAAQRTLYKVEEKYSLVDMEELKEEAKYLYRHAKEVFDRIGVNLKDFEYK